MNGEHERVVEELAAYVLESVEGPERAQIEAHVVACATCTGLLREYRAVVGTLPLSLERIAPPAEAWVAIREAARARRPHAASRAKTAQIMD